ncbi:transcriptional regulator, GntR family [Sphingobacterium spiritivorum ATCC 33300]|uniref:Transcriptional regulator, GntR family n=1 Tax=Sphingobacterium spiritivorum ATCC 33300 TaxID=525372 RepID=C2G4S1_SPHSI|nr:GntR family transcriptional regulator [Sphingobacterium spiritivorum]EEI89884.1 transcriptional regulator, GntR family [Sphingobacterium spiritivorum ATCC 33300]QQS94791.1 FadR family transcriptional regulator [Sphingobacterium spiritivorum]
MIKQKERLSDQVYKRIKEDIQHGLYVAGHKIPSESELMDIYKVGRSTIREAINSLASSGILLVKRGDGTYVRQLSEESAIDEHLRTANFEEVNDARRLLEAELVRRACISATIPQLNKVAHYLQLRKEAILTEDKSACIHADIQFHLHIASAANHHVFFILYQNFTHLISNFFQEREPRGISYFAMSHHLHEQLFEAIKAKDEQQALHVLASILTNNHSS